MEGPIRMVDPLLTLYSDQTAIAENDNWEAFLINAFASSGAWPWTLGSKDAALVFTLPPGGYAMHVRAADNTTGEALGEVFLVP
jgi:hypothetical protein